MAIHEAHNDSINRTKNRVHTIFPHSARQNHQRRSNEIRRTTTQVTLTGQTGAIYCVAWSPDGDRIASTSGEGTVWIWDVSTGRALERIRLHSRACHRVQWDPFHPKRLASVGADKR